MKIQILTGIYLLILAGIIITADFKSTSYLLNFVGNIPYGDKIGHFVLFGMFAFLANLSLGMRSFRGKRFNYLLGSLIVLIIITIEEFTQIFMRGRTFSWLDLLCGYAGVLIFGEIARIVYRKISDKKESDQQLEKLFR